MLLAKCDRCGRMIDGEEEADADGIRSKVNLPGKRYDDEYLYIVAGDEEGEPVGKHYCLSCVMLMLDGAPAITPSIAGAKKPSLVQQPDETKEEPEAEEDPESEGLEEPEGSEAEEPEESGAEEE